MAVSLIGASDRITERCVERAEGNPLFLEQLLQNAEESLDGIVATYGGTIDARRRAAWGR